VDAAGPELGQAREIVTDQRHVAIQPFDAGSFGQRREEPGEGRR
jgi:hypothetical protein